MTILIEVLNDLFCFVVGRDEKEIRIKANYEADGSTKVGNLTPSHQDDLIPKDDKIYQNKQNAPSLTLADYAQKQYVTSSKAQVWQHPYVSFDGVIESLPFSSMVLTGQQKGRFVQITDDRYGGWVMAENLTTDVSKTVPSFTHDKVYVSDSTETKLVRKLIGDEFSGSALLLPLQPEEYIAFKVKQMNKDMPWSNYRPRLAGNWQNLLKGSRGISIGVTPKTGSIMEWSKDSEGYLFYVEKVSPEEDLELSGVGYREEGIYSTLDFKREDWIELRPVFISIN